MCAVWCVYIKEWWMGGCMYPDSHRISKTCQSPPKDTCSEYGTRCHWKVPWFVKNNVGESEEQRNISRVFHTTSNACGILKNSMKATAILIHSEYKAYCPKAWDACQTQTLDNRRPWFTSREIHKKSLSKREVFTFIFCLLLTRH